MPLTIVLVLKKSLWLIVAVCANGTPLLIYQSHQLLNANQPPPLHQCAELNQWSGTRKNVTGNALQNALLQLDLKHQKFVDHLKISHNTGTPRNVLTSAHQLDIANGISQPEQLHLLLMIHAGRAKMTNLAPQ
jgi:hypothetical protein